MSIDYQLIKNWKLPEVKQSYTDKDSILYALSLGIGSEPLNTEDLKYIYEKELQAFPTMPVVLGFPGLWLNDPKTGVNYVHVVHGEQRLTLHDELPTSGTITSKSRVTHVVDKGADKGAIIIVRRDIYDDTGKLLATTDQTSFCRADGGFGGGDESPEALPKVPNREADAVEEIAISPQAASLYRLNGDWNPLHIDPEVAKKAGFNRPILHGLCTYGIAARAIIRNYCDGLSKRLVRHDVRFSSPVFSGETLVVEMWQQNDFEISFQAKVKERDAVVLSNGVSKVI